MSKKKTSGKRLATRCFPEGRKTFSAFLTYRQQQYPDFNPVRNFCLLVSYYCLVIEFLTGLTEKSQSSLSQGQVYLCESRGPVPIKPYVFGG